MLNVKLIPCIAASLMMATINDAVVHEELSWAVARSRVPRLRSHREFAEQEIVLPEGPYYGTRLRLHRQPFSGLLLDELDSGRWNRSAVVGCVQGGKSLFGFVEPTLYHLFECRETVICGLPTMDIAGDKFREELLPVIDRSRYRNLLPKRGPASRGGTGHLEFVKFAHGPTLKFMSGGGKDSKRSSFTSRVVVITEADKMDQPGEASREADPVTQLEARMLAYEQALRRLYMECTVSVAAGRIWREYLAGTVSKIACPCPHCRQYVTPEREHLVGWQAAESKMEAQRLATFVCPDCAAIITPEERVEMNRRAVLVHRGQEITPEGQVTGPLPETDTLGFRFNAFNNLFLSAGEIGAKEWAAREADNEDDAEKELCQFIWAVPWDPPKLDLTPLDVQVLKKRTAIDRKGVVPAETDFLTVGADLGKWVGWWIAIAWRTGGSSRIVDYGTFEVPSKDQDVAVAILNALREFRDGTIALGWPTSDGQARLPDQVWIDAGYQPASVYAFIRESGDRFRPALGQGAGQHYPSRYHKPSNTNQRVRAIGQEYHFVYMKDERVLVAEVNADAWKSFLHERLITPVDEPGAMTFYQSSDANEHLSISKHFTAEKQTEEFLAGKGWIKKWVRSSRRNHWFDAAYNACAAGHLCGVRLVKSPKPPSPPPAKRPRFTTPSGQPYLVTER